MLGSKLETMNTDDMLFTKINIIAIAIIFALFFLLFFIQERGFYKIGSKNVRKVFGNWFTDYIEFHLIFRLPTVPINKQVQLSENSTDFIPIELADLRSLNFKKFRKLNKELKSYDLLELENLKKELDEEHKAYTSAFLASSLNKKYSSELASYEKFHKIIYDQVDKKIMSIGFEDLLTERGRKIFENAIDDKWLSRQNGKIVYKKKHGSQAKIASLGKHIWKEKHIDTKAFGEVKEEFKKVFYAYISYYTNAKDKRDQFSKDDPIPPKHLAVLEKK
jgi:hypothetical protein